MQELLHGALICFLYLIPAAATMLIARRFLKIPDELFRKILHFILLGIYFPFLFAFRTWWISAGFAVILIVLLYPVLTLAGRIPAFSAFITERKKGEIRSSMILALSVVVVSITVCWGIFGDKMLVFACVYAWGVGDAFAALVGKRFGRHRIRLPLADVRKSVEGSAAMFVSSAVTVLVILLLRGGIGGLGCVVISLSAAAVTTFVEMCTKGGDDTVTCPAAAMLVILPLVKILGG